VFWQINRQQSFASNEFHEHPLNCFVYMIPAITNSLTIVPIPPSNLISTRAIFHGIILEGIQTPSSIE
jgi:hypothetical protein